MAVGGFIFVFVFLVGSALGDYLPCSSWNVNTLQATCGSHTYDLSGLINSPSQKYFSGIEGTYTYFVQLVDGGLPSTGVPNCAFGQGENVGNMVFFS